MATIKQIAEAAADYFFDRATTTRIWAHEAGFGWGSDEKCQDSTNHEYIDINHSNKSLLITTIEDSINKSFKAVSAHELAEIRDIPL